MRTAPIRLEDWRGVLPVPPLARLRNAARSLDFVQSSLLVEHMAAGGITRFLYGGNAFLYHVTLSEYAELLQWLAGFDPSHLAIPSAGPSYGRAMDQAPLLRRHGFPCVMLLPCGDPRDARGIEQGYREIADAAGMPLLVYLKEETNLGASREAGLDAVARLVSDGVCVGVKYAVVRHDPSQDAYLDALLARVDRARVISGIGERPAIAHMSKFGLPGFTTGSGCLAPRLSNDIWKLCSQGKFAQAERLRALFLPHEDLRDAWGPARVLHAAVGLAGLCHPGPIPPYVTPLDDAQAAQLGPVAAALAQANQPAPVG
jgi:dihydrodipicolinate synthase/N-acetylneuraminate lyase